MRSDRTLKAWYRELNTRWFDNELPDNVCVRWAEDDDEEKDFGSADLCHDGYHKYQILLNRESCSPVMTRLAILIHEMIHVKLELRDDHGPAFERVRKELSDKGIFKKGAVYKGVTLF